MKAIVFILKLCAIPYLILFLMVSCVGTKESNEPGYLVGKYMAAKLSTDSLEFRLYMKQFKPVPITYQATRCYWFTEDNSGETIKVDTSFTFTLENAIRNPLWCVAPPFREYKLPERVELIINEELKLIDRVCVPIGDTTYVYFH